MNKVRNITDDVTKGGNASIATGEPYTVDIKLRGVADLLLHRWNAEAVEEKAKAAKNSAAKKTDDLESYVYRCDDGTLALPGEYLRGSIINAAKFRQDPRSPRKSASDLFKAGVVSLTPLASLGIEHWHYEDKRRVLIQRQGINRVRPAVRTGWTVEMQFLITLPEYIGMDFLQEVVEMAGRLVGLADFRPTYGRFAVAGFELATV
jgi:hypothetical protein